MPLDQLSTPAAGLFPEFQHLELLAGQVQLLKIKTLPEAYTLVAKYALISRCRDAHCSASVLSACLMCLTVT